MDKEPAPTSEKSKPKSWRRREPPGLLVFSPTAWMKLMFFLHAGDTEVGGFAVTAAEHPLYVQDFVTVRQFVGPCSVEFDDASVADFFDRCVDAGLKPERFARIWVHTHPGESPEPSLTDEQTFARVFGSCDWSVMFIVGRTGRTYARLSFRAGPRGEVMLGVAVEWAAWPRVALEDSDRWAGELVGWAHEYDQNIYPHPPVRLDEHADASAGAPRAAATAADGENDGWWDYEEYEAYGWEYGPGGDGQPESGDEVGAEGPSDHPIEAAERGVPS